MAFLTFSYINVFGFLSFIVFLSQISSGILSSIYYNDFFTIASDPIIIIIININNGRFIRILHVIGASLFILLIPFHRIRAIRIKSKIIYTRFLTFIITTSGYLLFILSMIEGFIGHLLCRGHYRITSLSVIAILTVNAGITILYYINQ